MRIAGDGPQARTTPAGHTGPAAGRAATPAARITPAAAHNAARPARRAAGYIEAAQHSDAALSPAGDCGAQSRRASERTRWRSASSWAGSTRPNS